MRKSSPLLLTVLSFLIAASTSAFAGITITSPGSGSSVQSPVHFIASSSSSCSKGVAAMGVYDNNVLMATTDGSKMDTSVSLTSGTHSNIVIQYWDFCGNANKTSMSLKVDAAEDSGSTGGKTFSSIEEFNGWLAYGE